MPTDTRDTRAREKVECPVCHARPGDACRFAAGRAIGDATADARRIHSERRKAYQLWRDAGPSEDR